MISKKFKSKDQIEQILPPLKKSIAKVTCELEPLLKREAINIFYKQNNFILKLYINDNSLILTKTSQRKHFELDTFVFGHSWVVSLSPVTRGFLK